jgi:hypothetical protein
VYHERLIVKKLLVGIVMTTIELDDKLIGKILEIGHYLSPQKAIDTIVSDYIRLIRNKLPLLINYVLISIWLMKK